MLELAAAFNEVKFFEPKNCGIFLNVLNSYLLHGLVLLPPFHLSLDSLNPLAPVVENKAFPPSLGVLQVCLVALVHLASCHRPVKGHKDVENFGFQSGHWTKSALNQVRNLCLVDLFRSINWLQVLPV